MLCIKIKVKKSIKHLEIKDTTVLKILKGIHTLKKKLKRGDLESGLNRNTAESGSTPRYLCISLRQILFFGESF